MELKTAKLASSLEIFWSEFLKWRWKELKSKYLQDLHLGKCWCYLKFPTSFPQSISECDYEYQLFLKSTGYFSIWIYWGLFIQKYTNTEYSDTKFFSHLSFSVISPDTYRSNVIGRWLGPLTVAQLFFFFIFLHEHFSLFFNFSSKKNSPRTCHSLVLDSWLGPLTETQLVSYFSSFNIFHYFSTFPQRKFFLIALSWIGDWAHSLGPMGREGDGEERLITLFSCMQYIHNLFLI